MTGSWQLKDSAGNSIGNLKPVAKILTASQKTALVNFIKDEVGLLTDANAAEGM